MRCLSSEVIFLATVPATSPVTRAMAIVIGPMTSCAIAASPSPRRCCSTFSHGMMYGRSLLWLSPERVSWSSGRRKSTPESHPTIPGQPCIDITPTVSCTPKFLMQKRRMKWPEKEHTTPPMAPMSRACHGCATTFATEPMATPPAMEERCASKIESLRLPVKIDDAVSPARNERHQGFVLSASDDVGETFSVLGVPGRLS
jgi:hypothetical protein